jgi:hypothetical protein
VSIHELGFAGAAGVAAAIASGVMWAWLARDSDDRSMLLLLGIGWVTGWAVSRAALGARGRAVQAVALVSGLAGVLVGRYVLWAMVLADLGGAPAAASTVSVVFDPRTLSAFIDAFGDLFGVWDVVFSGLAVLIAWSMPNGIRLRRGSQQGPFG